MATRKWKAVRPAHSIGHATGLCLEDAMRRKNRSLKTVAGLMGVKYDTLHSWIGEDRIPVCKVAPFEHACEAHYLSDFLSAQAGRMVIWMPTGKISPLTLAELQVFQSEVIALLMRFSQQQIGPRETADALTALMVELAFQRENVMRTIEPDLDLFGGEA